MILGGSGFIGRQLFSHLGPECATATFNSHPLQGGVFFDSPEMALLDLPVDPSDYSHAVILLGHASPDFCAENPDRSRAVNVTGIEVVVEQLAAHGIIPVFASTEVVFDGEKGGYVETDAVNPILVYGRQKVEIEQYLQNRHESFLILRIAKVYDSRPTVGSLLGDWFHHAATGRKAIRCARDFVSNVIHVDDVVATIVCLMEHSSTGIYHLGGPAALSRLDIFSILLDEMKSAIGGINVTAVPCSIHEFQTVESRPLDVSMNTEKLRSETKLEPRDVRTACRELLISALAHTGENLAPTVP